MSEIHLNVKFGQTYDNWVGKGIPEEEPLVLP
jgi:hypothetical protein